MGRLRLKLLGGFEARIISGPVLDIATRKSRALLAYLALPTGRPHSRDKLVGLLWSDRGDEQARNSLRQALTELGKAFGSVEPSPFVKLRDTLALDPTTVEVDALLFEAFAARDTTSDLQRATELYAGDLLEGLNARDAVFDEWLTVERQRLRGLAATVFKKLLIQATGPNAIAVAQRLLALDPLQEEGYRALMRFYVEAGETSTALRQYEHCREILKSELDVKPSPETTALYQSIREQSVAPSQPRSRPSSSVDGQLEVYAEGEAAKPSIAVLPFTNMSGDPEQEYFSDGITNDIITELSRFRSLFVVARNSSFQYKGKNIDVRYAARELGAQYIVEGSMRKMVDRLRISAQLIDASTGNHLWSERYDRDIKDIFAVQDEVVSSIVAVLPGRIADAGGHSARRKRTESLTAYDYFLRAFAFLNVWDQTVEPREQVREMLEKAIALDPQFATAYSALATWYMGNWWIDRSAPALDQALVLAKKGAALDPNDSYCCWVLGYVSVYRKEFDDALTQFERAFALNPNDSDAIAAATWLLTYTGRAAEAINEIHTALDINPHAPPWYFISLGMALYAARRYKEAIAAFSRGFAAVDPFTTTYLAAAHGQLGRTVDARAQVAKFGDLKPTMSMLSYATHEPFREQTDLEHLLDGLRKAGAMG